MPFNSDTALVAKGYTAMVRVLTRVIGWPGRVVRAIVTNRWVQRVALGVFWTILSGLCLLLALNNYETLEYLAERLAFFPHFLALMSVCFLLIGFVMSIVLDPMYGSDPLSTEPAKRIDPDVFWVAMTRYSFLYIIVYTLGNLLSRMASLI